MGFGFLSFLCVLDGTPLAPLWMSVENGLPVAGSISFLLFRSLFDFSSVLGLFLRGGILAYFALRKKKANSFYPKRR